MTWYISVKFSLAECYVFFYPWDLIFDVLGGSCVQNTHKSTMKRLKSLLSLLFAAWLVTRVMSELADDIGIIRRGFWLPFRALFIPL